MAGALSTLGLGSQGVLTNDLIDQLKEADSTSIIKPIERKQESLKLQQAGLVGLKDAISDLSKLSTSLSDLALYQSKSVTVPENSGVEVTATSSAKAQNFDIKVSNIATRDIFQSEKFTSKTDTLTAGNMKLDIDGNSYNIAIEATDTLETLSAKILEATDGKIYATILNVGGDQPYQMILKSTDTGEQNRIITSGDMAFSQIGDPAQDAIFSVDGVTVTRSNNEISDLYDGITIKLLEAKETNQTASITQDSTKIAEKMGEFVSKYNELLDSIQTLTNYNEDTKVAGVFQGTSEIRNLTTPLKDIFSLAISDAGKMIEDFGLSSDRSGRLTLDEDKFKEALADDSLAVQNFFIGEGETKGIFREMNSNLFNIGTKSDGVLKSLKVNYDERSTQLIESLEKAQERLDSKYEIMQKKFAAYDAVIGRLSNQSSMLQGLIDSQSNNK